MSNKLDSITYKSLEVVAKLAQWRAAHITTTTAARSDGKPYGPVGSWICRHIIFKSGYLTSVLCLWESGGDTELVARLVNAAYKIQQSAIKRAALGGER